MTAHQVRPASPRRVLLGLAGGISSAVAALVVTALLGAAAPAASSAAPFQFAVDTATVSSTVTTTTPLPVTTLKAKGCAVVLLFGQVDLSWKAPVETGLSGYEVWRGTTLVAALSASAVSYTDPLGLSLGGTYTYKVRAFVGQARAWFAEKAVTVTVPGLTGCNTATTS